MINLVTGEVSFQSGLHIVPHRPVQLRHRTRRLSLKNWTRHILGSHASEHGTFEVEALSAGEGGILVVLLAHQHSSYKPDTPGDAERRAFHEGVVSADLGGQREFSWGEVVCRLVALENKDWLVVAYNKGANVPLRGGDILLSLLGHERVPDDDAS